MPHKTEKEKLGDPFLDRRIKLLPCQREMVHYSYNVRRMSITSIAKMFNVNKRLIQFELFPERKKQNLEHRKDRGGSKIYYDKTAWAETMRDHRSYKYSTLKDAPRQCKKPK